jgi:hypothetical protein
LIATSFGNRSSPRRFSPGSPVDQILNALATGVHKSDGEVFAWQGCLCRSPRHREDICDLGGTAIG